MTALNRSIAAGLWLSLLLVTAAAAETPAAAYKATLELDRKAERAAAKAMGEGSAAHLKCLDTLALHLGRAENYGEQLATAKRALALRSRGTDHSSMAYASALLTFTDDLTYWNDDHRDLGIQAIREARTILAANPKASSEAEATIWEQFASASYSYDQPVEDEIVGWSNALAYWEARQPLDADRAYALTDQLAFTQTIKARAFIDAVATRERGVSIAIDDPRPEKPLLGVAQLRRVQALTAIEDDPSVPFYRANALFFLSSALKELQKPQANPALLEEAKAEQAKLLAYMAERRVVERAKKASAALAEAERTGDLVATPGLAKMMTTLKNQGVNLEGGTK